MILRILMVILGVLLLGPGLCFIGFGGMFTASLPSYFHPLSLLFAVILLGIGGLICWGAVLLIINCGKPRP